MRWAIIESETDIVSNIIMWDGDHANYTVPPGYYAVQLGDRTWASPGYRINEVPTSD